MNVTKLDNSTRTVVITQRQLPRKQKSSCPRFARGFSALAATCVLLGGGYNAAAWDVYSDNFDDGNDTLPAPAWLHYDPINSVVSTYHNTYTCPVDPAGGNNYNLHAPASPNPGTVGPARTIAYRPDNYTNFNITADLMPGWAGGGGGNGTYVQAMGLVARLNNITIGQANGYAFLYLNSDQSAPSPFVHNSLTIVRITKENQYGLPGSGNGGPGETDWRSITLDNSKAYRFQFIGKGTHLEGRVYALTDTNTPIAVLDANTAGQSAVYESGQCGIIGVNQNDGSGNASAGTVDMTWDNYTASIHSPFEIRDDFNNASDGIQTYPPWSAPAWVHYDPLGDNSIGPAATYSFPGGNSYRIQAPAPYVPDYGSARAASFRGEVSYSDFFACVDVINWDGTQRMALGILGRVQNPGLGATTGYIQTWDPGSGALPNDTGGTTDINRLSGEAATTLRTTDTHLTTGNHYRLEFVGKGTNLTARIYDLSNASTLQAVVTVTDSTYTEGAVGLFSGSQGMSDPVATISGDVTYDNFYADTAEPRLDFSSDGSGHAVLKWPANLASIWTLQTSSSLAPSAVWPEVSGNAAQAIIYDPATGLNTYTNSATMSTSASTFFRLRRLDPLAYP